MATSIMSLVGVHSSLLDLFNVIQRFLFSVLISLRFGNQEYTVQVMLEGDIATSYTQADNKVVVTTDSMKNTVYGEP